MKSQSDHGNQDAHLPRGFFAYAASPPSIAATIRAAIQAVNRTHQIHIVSWEDLEMGGRVIIGEICDAIDNAEIFCADLTTVNANVMFELGYAIARNKHIWLTRDESVADGRKDFDQLRLLTTVGYASYVNSEQIVKAFFAGDVQKMKGRTVFASSIEPTLGPTGSGGRMLYLKSLHDTEASVRIARTLQESKLPLVVDDPKETAVQPLSWYAQNLYQANGFIVHFLGTNRIGFRVHNAKYALVSGLARGFGIESLMLSEHSDGQTPLDYRDAMKYYATPTDAVNRVEKWLTSGKFNEITEPSGKPIHIDVVRLATELKGFHLNLGEYVAENDRRLADYFVETTAYMDVVNGTHSIFVGRKGTGKTSILLRAAEQIGQQSNSLVVLIKPVGYEIEGLARLFASYKLRDHKGYAIESLWKYMLYTEIARSLCAHLQEPGSIWQLADGDAQELVQMVEDDAGIAGGDFALRLDKVVRSLESVAEDGPSESFRRGISEALHSGVLGKLRSILMKVLARKRQVILLVDNLDKPWTRSADLDQLAEFLLGLLGAAGRVGEELRQGASSQKSSVKFNSAVFLRSDIFNRITLVAGEPDKLSYTRLRWDDPELLLRIVEERYAASHGIESDTAQMWQKYFCPAVKGIPTRNYLTSRILPRPRDIVYFVKAAVSCAVNRKHDRVEEKDIIDGERQYSQYAWDSILVENGITVPQLESVLLEFVGCTCIVEESAASRFVVNAGLASNKIDGVIAHLVNLNFLGLEVSNGQFSYSDDPKETKKNRVRADHHVKERGGNRRFEINPAFRSYLEIQDNLMVESTETK